MCAPRTGGTSATSAQRNNQGRNLTLALPVAASEPPQQAASHLPWNRRAARDPERGTIQVASGRVQVGVVQGVGSFPPEPEFETLADGKDFGQSRVDTFEARRLENIASQVAIGAQGRYGECRSRRYTGEVLLLGKAACRD